MLLLTCRQMQPLRAAALKQLEESRKAAEDGQAGDQHSAAADATNLKDTAQASSAGARISTISSSQAGTLAAAPADVVHGSAAASGVARRASEAGYRSAAAGAAAAAAAAAAETEREKQLEREEKRYMELEAQFKEQLGLE
jgi:hypothetical protein